MDSLKLHYKYLRNIWTFIQITTEISSDGLTFPTERSTQNCQLLPVCEFGVCFDVNIIRPEYLFVKELSNYEFYMEISSIPIGYQPAIR